MKEQVLDVLKSLGFETKHVGDTGYEFEYEGKCYLYVSNEDDEEFLSIALPVIYEFEDKDDINAYKLMDRLNSKQKYVKACNIGGGVWLFYERKVGKDEDIKDTIAHMILYLEGGLSCFQSLLAEAAEDTEEAEEVEDDGDEE